MTTAIEVENLSKKYVISHEATDRYLTMRDILADKVKTMFDRKAKKAKKEDFWALKDVTFKVNEGDRLGIIGRNGAGKSTLLKLLSRITEPTEGKIKLAGRVSSLLEVGTGFHPELTGRENIFLNGAVLGMTRKEIISKFDEIVAFAEVERFLDTPVKRYSSGMYVRLAFAVAAHLDPEILLVDEVLAVGDYQFRKKCLGKMSEMEKSDKTLLFVSHDMGNIRSLCNKAIWIDKGEIKDAGQTNEVVRSYLNSIGNYFENKNPSIRKNTINKNLRGPKIIEASIIDNNGDYRTQFKADETFYINLKLDNSDKIDTKYSACWVLFNEIRQMIAIGESGMMNSIFYSSEASELKCHFKPLALCPGKYFFKLQLHLRHMSNRENFDAWDDALSFEITEHDCFNSGFSYPGSWNLSHYIDSQ